MHYFCHYYGFNSCHINLHVSINKFLCNFFFFHNTTSDASKTICVLFQIQLYYYSKRLKFIDAYLDLR